MTAPTTATLPGSRWETGRGPLLLALVAVFIWGGTPAATKLAVTDMDAVAAGLLRTLLAAAVVLPVVVVGRFSRPASARQWAALAVSALCGFIAFPLLFSLGTASTSAVHAALINAGIPVFTGIFGAIAERRLPGRLWWGGIGVALAGEALLILQRANGGGDVTLAGDLLCLASSAVAALGYVVGSRLTAVIGSVSVTFWGLGLAGLVLLPMVLAIPGTVPVATISAAGWAAVGYLAFGASVAAYVVWYKALAWGGPVRVGVAQFAMPVFSLSLAVVLLGEVPSLPALLAAVIIIGGIVLAKRG